MPCCYRKKLCRLRGKGLSSCSRTGHTSIAFSQPSPMTCTFTGLPTCMAGTIATFRTHRQGVQVIIRSPLGERLIYLSLVATRLPHVVICLATGPAQRGSIALVIILRMASHDYEGILYDASVSRCLSTSLSDGSLRENIPVTHMLGQAMSPSTS